MIRASPWLVPASCRSDAKGEATRNPLRGERTDGKHGKTALHPQTLGVRGLRGPESRGGLRRRGQGEDRGLRNELEPRSVSDRESDVASIVSAAVKAVAVPKKMGGNNILGVRTVGQNSKR